MRNKLIRIDTMRRAMHHYGMTRKRITISYDPEVIGFDIQELFEELAKAQDSPCFDRSVAAIGGMILAKYLQEELWRLPSVKRQKEVS